MSAEKADLPQMKLALHQGVMHPDYIEFDRIRDLACRSDDIWSCGVPRSGTTLIEHMVYLVQTLDFDKASTIPHKMRFPYIDYSSSSGDTLTGCKLVDSLPDSEARLIKTHLHYFLLPKELQEGKGRIIYSVRNPKSAAPSMFRLMSCMKQDVPDTMREYLENYLNGQGWACPWGPHVSQFWDHRNDGNMLFLQYENTVKDRRGTICKIAKFLNRDLTDEQIDKIYDATDIDKMRENKGVNLDEILGQININEGFGRFINTGQTTGWKKDIPEDLERRFDDMIEKEIGHTDIKF